MLASDLVHPEKIRAAIWHSQYARCLKAVIFGVRGRLEDAVPLNDHSLDALIARGAQVLEELKSRIANTDRANSELGVQIQISCGRISKTRATLARINALLA